MESAMTVFLDRPISVIVIPIRPMFQPVREEG
jgi:hypothetical protein